MSLSTYFKEESHTWPEEIEESLHENADLIVITALVVLDMGLTNAMLRQALHMQTVTVLDGNLPYSGGPMIRAIDLASGQIHTITRPITVIVTPLWNRLYMIKSIVWTMTVFVISRRLQAIGRNTE